MRLVVGVKGRFYGFQGNSGHSLNFLYEKCWDHQEERPKDSGKDGN